MYSMTGIQIDLNEEEDRILETFLLISGEKDKKHALKKLIQEFSKVHPKTKGVLNLISNKK